MSLSGSVDCVLAGFERPFLGSYFADSWELINAQFDSPVEYDNDDDLIAFVSDDIEGEVEGRECAGSGIVAAKLAKVVFVDVV